MSVLINDPWRPPGTKRPDPRGVRKFACIGTYPVGNVTVWQLQFYSIRQAAAYNYHRTQTISGWWLGYVANHE